MDNQGAYEANLDHLVRLVSKRDRLIEAIQETADALISTAGRQSWTPADATRDWNVLRRMSIPHLSGKFVEAVGYPQSYLLRWTKFSPPEPGQEISGSLPVAWDLLPARGIACVYLLLDDDLQCLYVGQSQAIATRLKTHHKKHLIPATRYQVFVTEGLPAALQLEADLIFQHQPPFNKVLTKQRAYRS